MADIARFTIDQYIANYANMPTNYLRQPTTEQKALYDWLRQFNDLVGERWPGADLFALADRPWHDWLELDDMTPEQAIEEVERDQGPELDEQFPSEKTDADC